MGRSTMPGDRHKHAAVLIAWGVMLAMPLAGGPAAAQNSSYISNNTSVIVDTEVLESLGGAPLARDSRVAPSPRQAVDVQRSAPAPRSLPAPLPSPTVARLPSPATALRSRLNPDAMARLGFKRIPPVAKQQAVARPPAAAPKSRTVAAVPPAPAVAPKPAVTQAAVPSPVRQAAKVPARPVLPTAQTPTPAVTRPAVTQASVAPPPPPAAPAPPTAPAARQPTVAAALVPPKQATRVASVARGDDDGLLLLFESGSAKLSDSARSNLQSLTAKMGADEALQVQLVAYAQGTAETSSQARRLSLSRALAVRSFLIDQGVRSTRMDIRALGNKAEDGPADRVDVVLVQK